MRKLLSLPPNLARPGAIGPTVFHDVTQLPAADYFCTSDPHGQRIGSGGGTAWLLRQTFIDEAADMAFAQWLSADKRILLHAGGQSRRLPAYAPSGKILTPVPVFRWERGQRLNQDLLSLQLPLYERIAGMSPEGLNTMVVSGDVFIRTTQPLPPVPQADVVCYGLWLDAAVASHHGVFLARRSRPAELLKMLQKPSVGRLQQLQHDHLFLTDIGLWLLSDRAVTLLMARAGIDPELPSAAVHPRYYDLYSDFGRALGTAPDVVDDELRSLSVAIVPLCGGEFYHFGTSREMISSALTLQNVVTDQRLIMHHDRKPHPSIFVQNAVTQLPFTPDNRNIWIENSFIGPRWTLSRDNIVTGVPRNDWQVQLAPGQCLDIVPIGTDRYAVRTYHIDDRFDGAEQQRPQFPVMKLEDIGTYLRSLTPSPSPKERSLTPSPSPKERGVVTSFAKELYTPLSLGEGPGVRLLSAEQLSDQASLQRLFAQREAFRAEVWPALAANWRHSVFYQLDLDHAAKQFADHGLPLPQPLEAGAPLMTQIHDAMFRGNSDEAFALLRKGLTAHVVGRRQLPRLAVSSDQIVWGRSPVRIDISGGWTDTPPFCLLEGGSVVNLAVDLNGQQPLQAYMRPAREARIVLRSIDLGATEVIETFDQLRQFNKVGSPFSIPKAALALAGFLPEFAAEQHASLAEQLQQFGAGIELTLLSAVPAGSGMGTSSILAATVLAVVSDFCSLAWDKSEIGQRTMVLEQLLTTGGGWQDQFGGIYGGVKLLQTFGGFRQQPLVRWLPDALYTLPDYKPCHLLYYTGITRTAKTILAEIVRRMFLNQHEQLLLLRLMKEQTMAMHDALQRQDFALMGRLLRTNWQHNQLLDSGTNPPAVSRLTALVDDLCLGYKLPGAGGGGFLYMVAKDPEAAARIRRLLTDNRLNANARFVDMALSAGGLQISRS